MWWRVVAGWVFGGVVGWRAAIWAEGIPVALRGCGLSSRTGAPSDDASGTVSPNCAHVFRRGAATKQYDALDTISVAEHSLDAHTPDPARRPLCAAPAWHTDETDPRPTAHPAHPAPPG